MSYLFKVVTQLAKEDYVEVAGTITDGQQGNCSPDNGS